MRQYVMTTPPAGLLSASRSIFMLVFICIFGLSSWSLAEDSADLSLVARLTQGVSEQLVIRGGDTQPRVFAVMPLNSKVPSIKDYSHEAIVKNLAAAYREQSAEASRNDIFLSVAAMQELASELGIAAIPSNFNKEFAGKLHSIGNVTELVFISIDAGTDSHTFSRVVRVFDLKTNSVSLTLRDPVHLNKAGEEKTVEMRVTQCIAASNGIYCDIAIQSLQDREIALGIDDLLVRSGKNSWSPAEGLFSTDGGTIAADGTMFLTAFVAQPIGFSPAEAVSVKAGITLDGNLHRFLSAPIQLNRLN